MKCFIYIVIICTTTYLPAQSQSAKVKADPGFHCRGYSFVDPLYSTGQMLDSSYGIPAIRDSPNEIEIRLTSTYGPSSIFEFAYLSFDGKKWSGKKYQFNLDPMYVHSDSSRALKEQKVFITPFRPDSLEIMFDTLKSNNIFTLPDLKDIKVEAAVKCGITYVLTFKTGDQLRTYQFNNTDKYMEKYPGIEAFRNYDTIARLMNKFAIKE
jgi:hypothetical protein